MDTEILEILKQIQKEQIQTNERLDRIEKKIDVTYDQVARSAEDITDVKKDLVFVEEATAKNLNDIEKLKTVKEQI